MLDEQTRIRVELDVASQKIVNQLIFNNEAIEKQIEAGVKKAVEDLSENNMLADMISEKIKEEVVSSISSHMYSYSIKEKVRELIKDKINSHLEGYTQTLLDDVIEQLGTLEIGKLFKDKKQE